MASAISLTYFSNDANPNLKRFLTDDFRFDP